VPCRPAGVPCRPSLCAFTLTNAPSCQMRTPPLVSRL
jgi:hypothetical protein